VPLNSEALRLLKHWEPEDAATRTFVFTNGRSAEPLGDVKKAWKSLVKKAELPAFRFHDLRHTFASKLVMAGVDLNTVRELLGHSDIGMTLRYAHLAPEHKAAAVGNHSFDSASTVEHPSGVSTLVQRLAALALAFGLVAGNAVAICAGWLPTPEARMACCADGVECPMHKGDSRSSASQRVLTQAQADGCCSAAERQNSNQSNPSFVTAITAAVLGVGVVLPANVPALVLSDAWRTSVPIPIAQIPKHVLLSVFLV